jgi:hypothetical protein
VSTQPSGPTAADRSPGDAAALLPTATGATQPAGHPAAGHVTADHVTADHVTADHPAVDHPSAGHVTAGEIAEFLRHLARFRPPAVGVDPADQAALLARKAELFARIADRHTHAVTDPPSTAAPTTPTTPEGRTP